MEQKKGYEKPQVNDSVNLEAIAGSCTGTGAKGAGSPGCTTIISS